MVSGVDWELYNGNILLMCQLKCPFKLYVWYVAIEKEKPSFKFFGLLIKKYENSKRNTNFETQLQLRLKIRKLWQQKIY